MEAFITDIKIEKVRNLDPAKLHLGSEPRHLILTGKNGSGKTTLLSALRTFLMHITNGNLSGYIAQKKTLQEYISQLDYAKTSAPNINHIKSLEHQINALENWLNQFGGVSLTFNSNTTVLELLRENKFVVAHFDAIRQNVLRSPTGIQKVNFPSPAAHGHTGNEFVQYIVNLKADRSFAKDDQDFESVEKIDKWFNHFESAFFKFFSGKNLELRFDRKDYNFKIIEDSKLPYTLSELSSGLGAIMTIATDLIMRMEEHNSQAYDMHGLVLIDEIETHLHVDLQKKILPFLTTFFPNLQFIVTTHSPFVLSSISNAMIYDLEGKILTSDLSNYSYGALLESFFDTDKYSNYLKTQILEFENLISIREPNEIETSRIRELRDYIFSAPRFLSDELTFKLQELEIFEKTRGKQ